MRRRLTSGGMMRRKALAVEGLRYLRGQSRLRGEEWRGK